MKSAPCVRLAMRIRPKMSENPAASRNSSPPSARLFSVWMTQNCMERSEAARWNQSSEAARWSSLLQVLRRREVPRVHRVLQELLGLVGPELADVGIGMDHRVHQP